eukprot:8788866-Ditylum_brightwellii.AAC.1
MTEILSGGVKNADVGANDVENAIVLGEPEALPKGKMTRKHPTPHKTRHKLRSDPRLKGKVIDLYTDIMHIGK